jgi:hypothetical protein
MNHEIMGEHTRGDGEKGDGRRDFMKWIKEKDHGWR